MDVKFPESLYSDRIEEMRQASAAVTVRVHYARHAVALEGCEDPLEGAFDSALTNGLVAIMRYNWPGQELDARGGRLHSARRLLAVVDDHGGVAGLGLSTDLLRQAVDGTDQVRHGRGDDEWVTVTPAAVEEVLGLDEHPSLKVLGRARRLTRDELFTELFREVADDSLEPDPKERSSEPDVEFCDNCGSECFLPFAYDFAGGTLAEGFCARCQSWRDSESAYEQAVDAQWARQVDD